MSYDRPTEFKPLSMMKLRSSPGEIINRVAQEGETFVIERNGQPLACLLPVSAFLPDVDQKRLEKDREELGEVYENYINGVTPHREIYFKVKHEKFSIKIVIPDGYPSNCPRVYVDEVEEKAPHRWKDGSLCIFGAMDSWNPGTKSLLDVLELSRKWLDGYKRWQVSGEWNLDNNYEEET